MIDKKAIVSGLAESSERYGDNTTIRALVQAIPSIGGTLDVLLSSKGAQIRNERIFSFLADLKARLERVEVQIESSSHEALFDLMVSAFDQVAKTRSIEKRKRFAEIVAGQLRALLSICPDLAFVVEGYERTARFELSSMRVA